VEVLAEEEEEATEDEGSPDTEAEATISKKHLHHFFSRNSPGRVQEVVCRQEIARETRKKNKWTA
jgi:hypothetical protein